ncbi:hypothetical protein BGZ63DRAFT_90029 [Mariannaea sp. PMI_226]|nr:hypothetical protein BGZ63DRAFT_90029 [Mariannaea sp. PMI_226]
MALNPDLPLLHSGRHDVSPSHLTVTRDSSSSASEITSAHDALEGWPNNSEHGSLPPSLQVPLRVRSVQHLYEDGSISSLNSTTTTSSPIRARVRSQSHASESLSLTGLSQLGLGASSLSREASNTNETAGTSDPTPSRSLAVYNDEVARTAQPQTPRHLPEARHQSQIDGYFTAPVGGHRERTVAARPITHMRRGLTRFVISPVGLRTSGYQGLFGGAENTGDG